MISGQVTASLAYLQENSRTGGSRLDRSSFKRSRAGEAQRTLVKAMI